MEPIVKSTLTALLLLLPITVFAGGANPADDTEQLTTKFGPDFSDFEMYQPFTMNEHDTYFQIWKSAERGFSDHYAINIAEIEGRTLASFKQEQDDAVLRNCKTLENSNEQSTTVNGYEALSWTNICEMDKMTVTTVQHAIMGEDKFYHQRKLWKFPVSSEKIAEWETLLGASSVCDTEGDKHPCTAE